MPAHHAPGAAGAPALPPPGDPMDLDSGPSAAAPADHDVAAGPPAAAAAASPPAPPNAARDLPPADAPADAAAMAPPAATPTKPPSSSQLPEYTTPPQFRNLILEVHRSAAAQRRESIPPSPVVEPGALHELDDATAPGRRRSSASGAIAGLEELRSRMESENERMQLDHSGAIEQLIQASRINLPVEDDSLKVVDALIRLDFEPAEGKKAGPAFFIRQLPVIFGRREGSTTKSFHHYGPDGSMIIEQNPHSMHESGHTGIRREKKRKRRKKGLGKSKSTSSATPDPSRPLGKLNVTQPNPDDIPIIHLPFDDGLGPPPTKKNISRQHLKLFWSRDKKRYELDVLGKNGAFIDGEYVTQNSRWVIPDTGYTIGLGEATRFRISVPPREAEVKIAPSPEEYSGNGSKMSFSFHDEHGEEVKPPRYGGKSVELIRSLQSHDGASGSEPDDSGNESDQEDDEHNRDDGEDGDIENSEEDEDDEDEDEQAAGSDVPMPSVPTVMVPRPQEASEESSDDEVSSSEDEEVMPLPIPEPKRGRGRPKKAETELREKQRELERREREKKQLEALQSVKEKEKEKTRQKEGEKLREKELAKEQERLRKDAVRRQKEEERRREKERKQQEKEERARKKQEKKEKEEARLFLPQPGVKRTPPSSETPTPRERSAPLGFHSPTPQDWNNEPIQYQPQHVSQSVIDPALYETSASPLAPGLQKPTKEQKPKKDKPTPRKKRTPSPEVTEADFPPEALLKPNASYVVLIYDAISNAEESALTLPQIYKAIEDKYPYFKVKVTTNGWQSSVRHNLSQHKAFAKVERSGKGWLWGIVPGVSIEKEKKGFQKPHPSPLLGYPNGIYVPPAGVPAYSMPQSYYHYAQASLLSNPIIPPPPSYLPTPPAYQAPRGNSASTPRVFDAPIPPPTGQQSGPKKKVSPEILADIHRLINEVKANTVPEVTKILTDVMAALRADDFALIDSLLQRWKSTSQIQQQLQATASSPPPAGTAASAPATAAKVKAPVAPQHDPNQLPPDFSIRRCTAEYLRALNPAQKKLAMARLLDFKRRRQEQQAAAAAAANPASPAPATSASPPPPPRTTTAGKAPAKTTAGKQPLKTLPAEAIEKLKLLPPEQLALIRQAQAQKALKRSAETDVGGVPKKVDVGGVATAATAATATAAGGTSEGKGGGGGGGEKAGDAAAPAAKGGGE